MNTNNIINKILGGKPTVDKRSKNFSWELGIPDENSIFGDNLECYFKKVKGHTGLGYYMASDKRELGSLNSNYIGSALKDVYNYIERQKIESFEIL